MKKTTTLFIILIIIISSIFYYKEVVVKGIYDICADYAYSYSAESVNDTVLSSLTMSTKYSDLISIEKNNAGEIVLMSSNSYKINQISREIVSFTEKRLKEKLSQGVEIPLFTFSGLKVISGYGPKIKYKTVNVVSVVCDFLSDFSQMGINQTLHSIYVEITSIVNIQAPFVEKNKECKTKVLINEAVLIGKIPEVYLNGKIFG